MLKIGQEWISKEHPHVSFKIYDGIVDTCVDAFDDESVPFDEQPETTKVFFWERSDPEAFEKFLDRIKGEDRESSFPYAWCGESKKSSILSKIKKYGMELKSN